MTKAELYKKACMLPLLPGVYIIRDKSDTIIYIGKAKRLKTRVSQYFREGVPHDAKVTQMIAHAFSFDVIVCQSEFEALVLEASQIKAHTPKYNILLKDDKGYSYVKVTKGDWPRLSAVLQKEDDGAEYIGPFTSAFAVRQMVETAQDCFLLPRCNREFPRDLGKGRPCLNAHIGKCMAVCSGKISREAYNDAVQSAVHMIRYGKKDIVKQLREKMEAAAERLDFETAALLRDQIAAIDRVAPGQKVVRGAEEDMDVLAFVGTTKAVCAAILRYRGGRLSDKREFSVPRHRRHPRPAGGISAPVLPGRRGDPQDHRGGRFARRPRGPGRSPCQNAGQRGQPVCAPAGRRGQAGDDGLHQRGGAPGPRERPLYPRGKAAGGDRPDAGPESPAPCHRELRHLQLGATAPASAA